MKKVEVLEIFLLVILVFSFSVYAQADDTTKIDKAYTCALEKANGKCKDLTLEEQAFSLLALSYQADVQDECKKALLDKSEDSKCWPKGSCKVKDTALAVLALKHVGGDTAQGVTWLLSKNSTPRDLTWYLQIDSKEEATCKISYGGKDFTTVIKADKTLTQGAGSCLTRGQNNYWLQISPSCLTNTFIVACDKSFISNLIYKKTNSNVFYISSDTKSAPESGSTENKVVSICFGNPCDYEGSLWATLALAKTGKDISPYLPFLNALATDNEKYLPSAFLHILTGDEEYFSKLTSLHASGSWDVRSSYGKFYDTALAILSLQNTNSEQADASKQWLLNTQPSNGCWQNSLRDTAFILYSVWPKVPSKGGGPAVDYCKDFSYFCVSPGECAEASGEQLSNYFCPSLSSICCNKAAIEKTCAEKSGRTCQEDEECTGSSIDASDTQNCCDSSCVKKQTQPECETNGYTCQSSCSDDQEEASYGCTAENVCCKTKEVPPVPSRSYWWIWVLVILIILVVLGIIFRTRLSLFLFKFKKGGKSPSRAEGAGPRFPPTAPFPGRFPSTRPGPFPRGAQLKVPAKLRPSEETDKELDETLKKLREMGK